MGDEKDALDRIEDRLKELTAVVEALSKEVSELKTKLASRPRRNTNG